MVAAHLLRWCSCRPSRCTRAPTTSPEPRRHSWHEKHEGIDDGRDRHAAEVADPDRERIHRSRHDRGASILRGVVGMIIDDTRMTTVFTRAE